MLCIVQSRLIIYDITLYVDSDLVQLQVFRLYTSHLFPLLVYSVQGLTASGFLCSFCVVTIFALLSV